MDQERPAEQLCRLQLVVMEGRQEPRANARVHERARAWSLRRLLNHLELRRPPGPQARCEPFRSAPTAELKRRSGRIELHREVVCTQEHPRPSLDPLSRRIHERMLAQRQSDSNRPPPDFRGGVTSASMARPIVPSNCVKAHPIPLSVDGKGASCGSWHGTRPRACHDRARRRCAMASHGSELSERDRQVEGRETHHLLRAA